jgi:beta-lactamase regulating signal transducer with metallopeptidase domain
MSDAATVFLPTLGRTTLWLILAGLTTATILHLARATWPAAHRLGWVVTLVVGWTFLRLPIVIPWYDAPASVGGANAETNVTAQPTLGPTENPSPLAGEGGEQSEPGERVREISNDKLKFAVIPEKSPGKAFHGLTNFAEISISPASRFDWALAALAGWALGVIGFMAAWLVGYLRFVRSLPSSLPADKAWLDQWGTLLLASGVRGFIPLRVTTDLGPMLCRLPRGYELLVPAALWRDLEIGQRGAILRHELAHYLRGDVWKSLAARVLALPHWFNPVSWWAVRRFEEAAEWACDRAATAETPPTTYAKALVLLGASTTGPAAYGSAARGPALAVRIRRLLNLQAKEDSMMKKTLLVASVLGLAALSLVRLQLVAKEPALREEPVIAEVAAQGEQSAQQIENTDEPAKSLTVAGEDLEIERKTVELAKAREALEFTEKLLRNGYATQVQRNVQAFAVKRAESDLRVAQAAKAAETSTASRKMVEQAQRAYEATLAAFEAETTTVGAVCEWSLKWMEAAANAARDQKQKVEAVSAHLERVRKLQAKIKSLYDSGTKDGKATEMAAANFYVAEAERRLAEVLEKNAATGADDTFRLPVYRNGRFVTEKDAATRVNDVELQILDLKFKVTELEGQLQETKVQFVAALDRLSKLKKAGKVVSEQEIRQLEYESAKLQVHQESLQKQVDLSRRKLQLYERLNAAPDSVTKPATPGLASKAKTPAPSAVTETTARADLRYNGKDFNAWAEELHDDLSPERRKEAIRALATFGANGYGPQAASEIFKAMRGYSVSNMDNSPEAILAATAVDVIQKIPRQEAMPLVVKALKSDNANERLFAVTVLRRVSPAPLDDLPILLEMLKDPDFEVRMRAMIDVARIDAQEPKLVSVLREALASDSQAKVSEAIHIVGGSWNLQTGQLLKPHATVPAVVPELIGLLKNTDKTISDMASDALLQIGAAAVSELEKVINAEGNPPKATKAEQVLKLIRERAAKE